MVGNVENTHIQESSRSSTAANWPRIRNPRRRGTEFMHSFFLSPLFFFLTNPAHPVCSNKMVQQLGAIPLSSNCPWCTLLQGITINEESDNDIQPDLLQSASKRRQASAIVAPRVPTKKRKMITKRIIKKIVQSSPSPSDTNSNQVIHLFWNFSLLCTYILADRNSIFRTQLKTSLKLTLQMLWRMCWMNRLTQLKPLLSSPIQPDKLHQSWSSLPVQNR